MKTGKDFKRILRQFDAIALKPEMQGKKVRLPGVRQKEAGQLFGQIRTPLRRGERLFVSMDVPHVIENYYVNESMTLEGDRKKTTTIKTFPLTEREKKFAP